MNTAKAATISRQRALLDALDRAEKALGNNPSPETTAAMATASADWYAAYPEISPEIGRAILAARQVPVELRGFPKRPSADRERNAFYDSAEWKRLRHDALRKNDGRCELCGQSKHDGPDVTLHVDHIVPLSKDWSRRADPANLQVLCGDCNLGKSNRDQTDWRDRNR